MSVRLAVFTESECEQLRKIARRIVALNSIMAAVSDAEVTGEHVFSLLSPIDSDLWNLLEDLEERVKSAKRGVSS